MLCQSIHHVAARGCPHLGQFSAPPIKSALEGIMTAGSAGIGAGAAG